MKMSSIFRIGETSVLRKGAIGKASWFRTDCTKSIQTNKVFEMIEIIAITGNYIKQKNHSEYETMVLN